MNEKNVEPDKTAEPEKNLAKGPTKLSKLRGNHNFRIGLIAVLLVIVAIMFIFWTKARIALAIIFVTLLTALGLEVSQNDWDLQKLWESKSSQDSKISRDVQGNVLFDKFGEITTDATRGKTSDQYNCADFETQPDAQLFFEKVGGTENDVNRLDGNNDGEACESLPKDSSN
ncbi:excalibur calcium-binding domain-containing protein [Candidatus Woesebacteria bacterium]|nr:excalibur calcium-binding domain-containing protein [Candidatus Woesebacteria bacterium]